MRINRTAEHILCFALVFVLMFSLLSFEAGASDDFENTSGNAMVSMCVDNGQFLFSSRGDEKVAPTVAAKLVATMVIYDLFTENDQKFEETQVTVTAESLMTIGAIGDISAPTMGFSAGNTYYAKDMLSAALVANANDACSALAYYCGETFLGGGIADFIARMNKKAAELGLVHTKFVNATGLDNVAQYTTPNEVAKIAAAFYRYDYLVKLSNVESFLFNGKSTVRNKNYLLSNFFVSGFLNKHAIGMIAGQKNAKGDYCVITSCEKEGRAYVFVVMCASGMLVDEDGNRSFGPKNAYEDINRLIDWVLSSFEYITVASTKDTVDEIHVNLGNSVDYVIVVPANEVESLVNVSADSGEIEKIITYDDSLVYQSEFNGNTVNTVDAPINQGQKLGTVTYKYHGMELATVDLVAKESIDSSGMLTFLSNVKNFLFGNVMKTILIIIGVILGLYVLIALTTAIVRFVKKVKKNQNGQEDKTEEDPKTSSEKNKERKKRKKAVPKKSSEAKDTRTKEIK